MYVNFSQWSYEVDTIIPMLQMKFNLFNIIELMNHNTDIWTQIYLTLKPFYFLEYHGDKFTDSCYNFSFSSLPDLAR